MVTVLNRWDIVVTGTDNIHYNTYTNDTLITQKISLRYLNTPQSTVIFYWSTIPPLLSAGGVD